MSYFPDYDYEKVREKKIEMIVDFCWLLNNLSNEILYELDISLKAKEPKKISINKKQLKKFKKVCDFLNITNYMTCDKLYVYPIS